MPTDTPRAIAAAGTATLLGTASLTIMVGCIIVPGLPRIASALAIKHEASWLITLPSLGVVAFGPVAGRMIERLGAYKALCIGLALYGVLGGLAVVLRGALPVLADRLVLGGATALVMSAGTMLIAEFYTGDDRLRMIAWQGMAIELGGVVFLAAGGYLADLSWRLPFALYGIAFILLAFVVLFVPVVAAAREGSWRAGPAPTSDNTGTVYLIASSSMLIFFCAVIILPFRLSGPGVGFDQAQVGYFLSFVSLVAVGFASALPRISGRIGGLATIQLAFACYALAHLAFALAPGVMVLFIGAIALGAGFGLSIPLVNHLIIERSSKQARGRNLARLSMAIFLGQFLATPMTAVSATITSGFEIAAFVALVSVCFANAVRRREGRSGMVGD